MENSMKLAIQAYNELLSLNDQGIKDKMQYFEVTKKYVNLKHSHCNNTEWELNGNIYRMYNSFCSEEYHYRMFAEDVAMMVYRLNGGIEHNTMTLVDYIKTLKEGIKNG